MKFLKTIQFDPSDTFVFEQAANPDEWAIPGGFMFANMTEDELIGKLKQAFSNGFLSLETFGNSTFVSVSEISEVQTDAITKALADYLTENFNAPSMDEARDAAKTEINFVTDMCTDVPVNSIFTLRRIFDDDGMIREEFRIVDAPGKKLHTKVWEVVED